MKRNRHVLYTRNLCDLDQIHWTWRLTLVTCTHTAFLQCVPHTYVLPKDTFHWKKVGLGEERGPHECLNHSRKGFCLKGSNERFNEAWLSLSPSPHSPLMSAQSLSHVSVLILFNAKHLIKGQNWYFYLERQQNFSLVKCVSSWWDIQLQPSQWRFFARLTIVHCLHCISFHYAIERILWRINL